MKKIILTLLILFFGSLAIHAYTKADIDKAYNYLSKKWSYYDKNGNKIKVSNLGRSSSGSDHQIQVNKKSLDPKIVYDENGQSIVDPSKKNNAKPVVVIGKEPGVLKGITEAHNVFRRKTAGGLPDLVWDNSIAAYAQSWANHLKKNNNCNMEHRSGSNNKKKYGENLAWAGGQEFSSLDPVQMWYDEIKDYDYKNNSCSGVCGHYTQVVWKKSKRVGCGMARCGKSEVWVCNYDPPGNYVGQKPY